MTQKMQATGLPSYALNGKPIDRQGFYRVACDPLRSVAVEACAGSGKTWILVSRMLRAVLAPILQASMGTPPFEPHQILAITFTKKAAGEMRKRFDELLEQCIDADDPALMELLRQRGLDPDASSSRLAAVRTACEQCLVAARPVQVRTIHGWFAALLRGAPLSALQELGLPLDYALLEDDAQAARELWPRFYRVLHKDSAAREDFSSLVATHGRQKIQDALESTLAKRLEFSLADAHGAAEHAVRHFADQFQVFAGLNEPQDLLWRSGTAQDVLAQAALVLGRAKAETYSQAGAALRKALDAQDYDQAWRSLFTLTDSPRKFNDKIVGIAQVRESQDLMQAVQEARRQHDAWIYHQHMTRMARIAVAEFNTLKRERGWVDMPDLERAALHLLGDPVLSGWIQERLDAGLRHLLIDEFQDTSPLQWQALSAWLSAYAGAVGQRPSVFIVGDPKQSIYRFRGAAPKVFAAAQDFVREALDGVLLSCDHTWRNAPAVIEAVNGVMSIASAATVAGASGPAFRPHSTESSAFGAVLQLPMLERPARTHKPAGPLDEEDGEELEAETGWRDSLTTPRLLPDEQLRLRECRQAAAWVAQRLVQGVLADQVMVLARQRNRLVSMEQALLELGIACQQPERTELGQRCEVQDMLALLDVLVSPGHDLSLARALKSPLFDLEDEALADLALQLRQHHAAGTGVDAHRTSWFEWLCAMPQAQPPWLGIRACLLRWKQWLDQWPCHDALSAIYEDGEVLRRFAQASPPAMQAPVQANLRALLTASLEMDSGRYVTPYAFVRHMRSSRVRATAASISQAVSLLTIHGAKGLEADCVLLLDTDAAAGARARPGVLMNWPLEQAAPSKFAYVLDERNPPACCTTEFALEQAAREREELNALYVAMTRARRELAVSALQSARPAGQSWWAMLAPWTTPVDSVVPTPTPMRPIVFTQDLAAPSTVAGSLVSAATTRVGLWTLPAWHGQFDACANASAPSLAADGPAQAQAAQLGSAMHRLLELWPMGLGQPNAAMKERVAKEFELDNPTLEQACAMASRIVHGEGAWAWDPMNLEWWQNELDIVYGGRLLRIDRLVRLRGNGQWWVLDYKSSGDSLKRPQRIGQLALYREAVCDAMADHQVRAAFLGADGSMEVLL